MSFSVSISGLPPFSAIMLAPKLDCSGVKRQSWLSTTSATASRLISMTMRMPSRSDSSRRSAMPSMRFSRTSSAMLLDQRRLVDLIGDLGDDDRFAVLAQFLDRDLRAA